jgi:hypothetical protein
MMKRLKQSRLETHTDLEKLDEALIEFDKALAKGTESFTPEVYDLYSHLRDGLKNLQPMGSYLKNERGSGK